MFSFSNDCYNAVFLPVVAAFIALSAQAKIINYTFTGVIMDFEATPVLDEVRINGGDTFVETFSVDTAATPIFRGPAGGNYHNSIPAFSSRLTITNSDPAKTAFVTLFTSIFYQRITL